MKNNVLWSSSLCVLTVMATTAAFADQVDLSAVVLQRLKQTAADKKPANGPLTAIKLKGDINSTGIKFTLPSVVPEKPLVLMQQKVANCNTQDVTGHASVNKSTENSETFTKSTTLGGETSLTVSYESPIGLGGSGTQSFNYSKTNTEEKTQSETIGWDAGIDFPVGKKQAVTMQFVVSEQKLDNIPWSTTVIVSGPVELTYTKPSGTVTVCAYENVNFGGKQKCWTTGSRHEENNFKKVKWESGKGDLNDQISSMRITGGAKVTMYKDSDKKGKSQTYTGDVAWVGKEWNDMFSSMVIEPQGGSVTETVMIEQYLTTDALRRVALSGTYKGVNGVSGYFLAGAPTDLTDVDCGLAAPSAIKAKSSGRNAAPKAAAPQAVSAAANPVTAQQVPANAVPQKGQILKSGIKPVKM